MASDGAARGRTSANCPLLRLNFATFERPILKVSYVVSKLTLRETAHRLEDRLQDHPAVRDERHEETQHAALR